MELKTRLGYLRPCLKQQQKGGQPALETETISNKQKTETIYNNTGVQKANKKCPRGGACSHSQVIATAEAEAGGSFQCSLPA